MKVKQKNTSIRDVAEKAGVSIAAVSRTLNKKNSEVSEEIRKRVLDACRDLGYQINPSIQDLVRKGRNGHTRNLAFVMIGKEFADPAYSRLLDGFARGINEFNYNLVLAHLSGKEKTVYELPHVLRDGRVDGMLVTGELDKGLMSIIKKIEKPYIILGNYSEKISGDSFRIQLNISSAMMKIVEEMRKAGKRRIAYFTEEPANYFEIESFEAFKRALKEVNLPLDEGIVYRGAGNFTGAFSLLKPVFSGEKIPFDSIICMDFRCAQEISHLIMRHGLDNPAGVLLAATRPFAYYKLPVPAVYCEGNEDEFAYQGVKILVSTLMEKEVQSNMKIELCPEISVKF